MALLDQIVLYISILIATPRISYLLPWQIIIHTHTPISVQCTQWGGGRGQKRQSHLYNVSPCWVPNGQSFCSAFSGCMWWAGSCSLPLFHGLIQQFRSIIKIKYACYNRLAYNSFNFHLSLIWTPQGKKERREKGRMGGGKKLLCTFA